MSRVQEALAKVSQGYNLTQEEAAAAMEEIMTGQATNAQIAALIMGLGMKGETAEEIAGCALVMREKATPVLTRHPHVVDTCGTGGDGAMTFNISTTVAFVLAGAGIPVAKHGNRSVSSRSGSADVLEALGVNLAISPEQVGASLDQLGIGFLFAPALHGAMKYAAGPRKELGIRTIFNILGPLTYPAKAQGQVLGVFNPVLTETMAEVLLRMGTREAFVLHGYQGLDEISLSGPSKVTRLHEGRLETFALNPEEYGLLKVDNSALVGGSAEQNAAITLKILQGEQGPHRDVVLINAALGIMAGQGAEDIREGLTLAAKSIDSGAALAKLEELIA
ncbi:MAG TPA: anthranilate phosphoribosyltransferase, partial [Bacillota bacterium]|nr:anthranilate phosphoribosyltransferase [Bacillota bacterium]